MRSAPPCSLWPTGRIVLVSLLAFVFGGCTDWITRSGEPADSILFISDRDANGAKNPSGFPLTDIYRIDADGSRLDNLTRKPAGYRSLSPSPDGRSVAFASDYTADGSYTWCNRIWVMDPNGKNQSQRTETCSVFPLWSPDGEHIAFQSSDDWHTGVFVISKSGSGLRAVSPPEATTTSGTSGAQEETCATAMGPRWRLLSWLPDGRIYFANFVCGQGSRAFTARWDGTGMAELDIHPSRNPSWSPDGSQVAYGAYVNGEWGLFVRNADGSGARKVPGIGGARIDLPGNAQHRAWSPDGTRFVFHGESGLSVIRPDGSGLITLTPGVGAVFHGWSPRGDRILFRSPTDHDSWDLYVVNADGTGLRNLTNHNSKIIDAAWLPRRG